MSIAYGKKNDAVTGPVFNGYKVSGNQIIIQFSHTGSGLRTDGKPLQYFQIAGEDHIFVWADARIVGNTVLVSAKGITKPAAVRYAWADSPVSANLYNKEGYPASAFRTDQWKGVTEK
jgi:sialate O-acetylesterase